jgi:DNA invertase Pin-like site-specific DNA recombinase
VDLVTVWKLDRAFRSAIECLNTLEDWRARGVHSSAVGQLEMDTATPIGRLLLTVLAAVAEFERDLIRERVNDGIANARRKGRPPVIERPGFSDRWVAVSDNCSMVRSASAPRRESWGSAPAWRDC